MKKAQEEEELRRIEAEKAAEAKKAEEQKKKAQEEEEARRIEAGKAAEAKKAEEQKKAQEEEEARRIEAEQEALKRKKSQELAEDKEELFKLIRQMNEDHDVGDDSTKGTFQDAAGRFLKTIPKLLSNNISKEDRAAIIDTLLKAGLYFKADIIYVHVKNRCLDSL